MAFLPDAGPTRRDKRRMPARRGSVVDAFMDNVLEDGHVPWYKKVVLEEAGLPPPCLPLLPFDLKSLTLNGGQQAWAAKRSGGVEV